jgi:hypothetical protein
MATAHKVMVTVRNQSGQVKVFPYTTADTNTTALLAPSGSDAIVFSNQNSQIIDYVHSTQGTCTKVYIYFNNVQVPYVIYTAASLHTVNRQVRNAPIAVPGGTIVQFRTIT